MDNGFGFSAESFLKNATAFFLVLMRVLVIPVEVYHAVAEVLGYIYRLRGATSA